VSPRKSTEREAAATAPATAAGHPVRAAYYYRTRWGSHDEFVDLFIRNHWPILRAQRESGRILDVTMEVPRFHGDGRADWDVVVTITWRDWAAIQEHSDPPITSRLFPDREAHAAEERRRFALLEAHWDVPLEAVALPETAAVPAPKRRPRR
jgi:hypothetical protein